MKIFLMKTPGEYGQNTVQIERDSGCVPYWQSIGYIQISDVMEVEFPMFAKEQVIAGEVSALDVKRAEVVEEFTKKLHSIDERKAKLLAIAAPVPA